LFNVAHFAKRRRDNVQGFQQDEVAVCHVRGCCGRKAGVCQYLHHIRLRITLSITTDNIVCTTSLDDEMKEGAHGAFSSEMMKLPQATWIATFLEGTTDKSTGQPIFKELVWFTYKVSDVMFSASACGHCWSIEVWMHSKRRNRLTEELVERLLRAHTNLVLRGRVWMPSCIIYFRGT
jgi:hypothetical protein